MDPRTAPDLSGDYRTLDQAAAHIVTLREKINAFRGGEPPPFEFRAESAPRGGNSVEHRLFAVVRESPPRTLAPIIGDAIHNIRSALDYLVYELAPPEVRATGSTQFPIFRDEDGFKTRGSKMLTGITGDERMLIERAQPYIASNPPRHDPLAILQKLSNDDKHRLLVPMIAAVSSQNVWVGADNADIEFTHIASGPVEHDTRIVTFTATPRDRSKGMTVHPQSGLEIQLAGTGANDRDIEVADLLGMLHSHVRHTVIGAWFEYGFMPPTWAEMQASQTKPQPTQSA